MPKKNVIDAGILDVGSPQAYENVAKTLNQQIGDLRRFGSQAMPLVQRGLEYRIFPPMIANLGIYPARQLGMKMRWKSRKQMIAVMIKLRKEGNVPYKRTLDLRNHWKKIISLNLKSGELRVQIFNDAVSKDENGMLVRYQRFVTGDIGLGTSKASIQRYQAPIQPFHKDRGWQPAYPIIARYYAQAVTFARERFEETLTKIAKDNAA